MYSGADGNLLREAFGSTGDSLGYSVSGVGDFNGDDHDDYLVGASPAPFLSAGYANVYSGRTGNVLHSFLGLFPWVLYDLSVGGVGDVDRDGLDDVIVGTPSCCDGGRASVHRGHDLFLSADPTSLLPGETLTLTMWEGRLGDPVYLYGVDVNGTPILKLVDAGTFDVQGQRIVSGTVPPGFTDST